MITYPFRKFTMNMSNTTLDKLEAASRILQMTKSDIVRKCIELELDCLIAKDITEKNSRRQMLAAE